MTSDIAITAKQVLDTPGTEIEHDFLARRPLTAAELELLRRSEWLRTLPVDFDNDAFVRADLIHPQSRAYALHFIRAIYSPHISPPEQKRVLEHNACQKVIEDINIRFTSRIAPVEGEYLHGKDWGHGWPNFSVEFGLLELHHDMRLPT